jgi:NTP pyrophosphatase (non-canonical NTP hydrolase)
MKMELRELAKKIHQTNKEKGFWDSERNVGEMLMLVVTELSEALEVHRKSPVSPLTPSVLAGIDGDNDTLFKIDFETHVKDTFGDEIADAIIRLLDIGEGLGYDIQKHVEMKMRYNQTRERLHGKRY